MHAMTRDNLEAAFAGESQAHLKYLVFADKAEREGLPEVARLFRATAYAEQVHATNHLRALKGVGKTAENLEAARAGEIHEIEEMYPAFLAVAKLQLETGAQRPMDWALEAEKVHAELYAQALEAAEAGKDAQVGEVHVCEVCGWTGTGEAPDECPLCKARKDRFRTF